MPELPRPRIILKQVETLPEKNTKGEMVYLDQDDHPYIYQKEKA